MGGLKYCRLLFVNLICLGLAIGLAGCQDRQVSVQCRPYRGWEKAYYLSNGEAEAVVVPEVGRVVSYRRYGEANVLWENPDPLAASARARLPSDSPAWINYGGQKFWAWPQDHWADWFGRTWPPPPQFDQLPQQVNVLKSGAVRLVSPRIQGQNWRVVQTITLAARGAQLTLQARIEPCRPGLPPPKNRPAVWSVVQLPPPRALFAHLLDNGKIRPIQFLARLKTIRRDGNWMEFDPETNNQTKLGLDADALGWTNGRQWFLARLAGSSPGQWAPAERAQIYVEPRDPKYIELEFISASPRKGWPSLTVTWTLDRPGKGVAAQFR